MEVIKLPELAPQHTRAHTRQRRARAVGQDMPWEGGGPRVFEVSGSSDVFLSATGTWALTGTGQKAGIKSWRPGVGGAGSATMRVAEGPHQAWGAGHLAVTDWAPAKTEHNLNGGGHCCE